MSMLAAIEDDLEPQANTVSSPYTLRIMTSLEDLLDLAQPWLELEAEAEGAVFFQSFGFVQTAARHVVEHSGDGQFRVLCIYSGARLDAVLPLRLEDKGGRKRLLGLGEPFQQYTEMVCRAGADHKAMFELMLKHIKAMGADFLFFGKVRKSGALAKAIAGRMMPVGAVAGAPFVPLSQWPDFETYFKTLNAKTRKNMRNARNRLERDGKIMHRAAETGPILQDVIAHTYEGRVEWLKRMGLTSQAFADAGFQGFLRRLANPETTGMRMLACQLMYNDTPMAEQFGFIHNGRYYAYIAALDTEMEEASPGKLHLGEVIKACFDRGLDCADFLIPAVPYKFTWAPEAEQVHDYVLPLSIVGQIYARGWMGLLRPTLKRLLYAIPAGLRQKLMAFKP